jgi:hypothetical protein
MRRAPRSARILPALLPVMRPGGKYSSIPPGNPHDYSVTATNTHAPTWTWSSGGGGNGSYAYRLLTYPGGADAGSGTVQAASYTPSSNLSDGEHVFNVQEVDDHEVWSATGTKTVVVTPYIPYAGKPG